MREPVWKIARRRALRETLELIRLDQPSRALLTLGTPLAAFVFAWLFWGQIALATLVSLGSSLCLGVLVFIGKLVNMPARMVAEHREEYARLQVEIASLKDIEAHAEGRRRQNLMTKLIRLYMTSGDGISPALYAGLELPPKDWLNEQLAMMGETWSIMEIRGTDYSTFEVVGPA